jgi:hypothetical protein
MAFNVYVSYLIRCINKIDLNCNFVQFFFLKNYLEISVKKEAYMNFLIDSHDKRLTQ